MGTLKEGARNAVEVCMHIGSADKVLIVTDEPRYSIGRAIYDVAREASGKDPAFYVLEDPDKHPVYSVPKKIAESIKDSNASFWVTNERHPYVLENDFVDLVMSGGKRRHAHMSGVTEEIMQTGVCVDYKKIAKFTNYVHDKVKDCKEIVIEGGSNNRTNLTVKTNPNYKWIPDRGIINEGLWDNIPAGEDGTTPGEVNGFVETALFGDYFDRELGILNPPATFEIKDSRVLLDTLYCPRDINKALSKYMSKDPNANRISEVAVPTNYPLMSKPLVGNILQDEKAETHLAVGDPPVEEIGASWTSSVHMDFLLGKCNVTVDGEPLIRNGRYVFDPESLH